MSKQTPQQQLGKQRADDVMRKWGAGWSYIGDEFKEGAIAREMMGVIAANTHHSEIAQHFYDTWQAMRRRAALDD